MLECRILTFIVENLMKVLNKNNILQNGSVQFQKIFTVDAQFGKISSTFEVSNYEIEMFFCPSIFEIDW